MSLDASVFARHLDLKPLRGRRRGLVRCRFHKDETPSLSVDLDRGIFNCFGCGEQGGVRRFTELVGEASADPCRKPRPPEGEPERARREVLEREERAAARRAEWLPWYAANDHIRRCWNAARDARAVATRLGPEHLRTWPLLERAAAVEREGFVIEAELDAILAEGSISE